MSNPVNNYIHSETVHNTKAAEAFLPILLDYIKPHSVVDVGCGLGTWLKVFEANGINEVLGVDGNYIDQSKLQINKKDFLLHDLTEPLNHDRKFDLAICLEVAEHLPETSSDIIIDTLTCLSETILFSAALPNQGGQNHINEQTFSYWTEKFNKKGFVVKDLFREKIWQNEDINWWYRQNMFLVVKSEEKQLPILDFYHPARYQQIIAEVDSSNKRIRDFYNGKISPKQAAKTFLKSLLLRGK